MAKFWENEMVRQKEIFKVDTYRQQMTMLNKTKGFKSPLIFYEIKCKRLYTGPKNLLQKY
jgi:hypothetical protein